MYNMAAANLSLSSSNPPIARLHLSHRAPLILFVLWQWSIHRFLSVGLSPHISHSFARATTENASYSRYFLDGCPSNRLLVDRGLSVRFVADISLALSTHTRQRRLPSLDV